MKIPSVWTEAFSNYIENGLMNEAARLFRIHQLPDTREVWEERRTELRQLIWEKIGVKPDHSLDLNLRETGEIQMDGYTIKNVYYQSRPGLYVTGNLYIPEGEGPFPGVVGMHGHWAQGRLAERVQSRGHSLAKNGYVCLLVDAWGSGERSTTHGDFEYHGAGLGGALFNLGESLMGAQIVDNMRAVDVLCSLEYVDSDRIGATGASGGGNQTMWLSAMDERIRAAVPVVSVGTFQSYIMRSNCICECLPDGLTFTEESGVLGLIAPRALKICNCLEDSNPTFFPSEMLRSYNETRKVYKAYGKDTELSYQIFNMPHGYWPEIRQAMLGWFDLHLKDVGHGAPKLEIGFEHLPEEKLMVFEKGERPDEVISIADYCRQKGAQLKEAAGTVDCDAGCKKEQLKKIVKFSPDLKLKYAHQYADNSGWETFSLETTCGRMIPVLLKKPQDGSKDYVLGSSSNGKADLAGSKYFAELESSKKGVVLFDVYCSGETASIDESASRLSPYHTVSRALLWLGRTLYGEWCREYALLAKWVKEGLGADNIELFGYKEAGITAIITSTLLEENVPVAAEKSPKTFVFNDNQTSSELSMGYCLPNILKWGDIDTIISLNASEISYID